MRTPFSGVGTALITPFKKDGSDRRGRGQAPGAAADRRGRPLPVAVRDDGRGAHAEPQGKAARRGAGGRGDQRRRCRCWPGAGGYDTRETVELARDMDKAGRRRPAVGDALLQQADAGRAVSALQGDRAEHLAADRALQRAVADGDQHGRRHHGAALGDPEHRRHQGAGRPRPDVRASSRRRREGFLRAERRRSGGRGGHGDRRAPASSRWRRTRRPPRWCRSSRCARRATTPAARKLHHWLLPLIQVNFVESNPIPCKAAMAAMGLIDEVYRLPLVSPEPGGARKGDGRAAAAAPPGRGRARVMTDLAAADHRARRTGRRRTERPGPRDASRVCARSWRPGASAPPSPTRRRPPAGASTSG